MRHVSQAKRNARAGFTLVELLVVIGIIALLISILLPSLNKAREAGRRVKCLSNMRQIGMAMNMFAQDNKGWMPARATTNIYVIDPKGSYKQLAGAGVTQLDATSQANWISYVRATDPVTGQQMNGTTAGKPNDQNITFSSLAKYMGSKLVMHTTPAGAHEANLQLDSVFRCPSDSLDGRYNENNIAGSFVYRYSYSANDNYMAGPNGGAGQGWNLNGGNPPPAPFDSYNTCPKNMRSDGPFNGKLASIKRTSEKVLLYCQDKANVDDGSFTPNPYNLKLLGGTTGGIDQLSSYHEGTNRGVISRTGANNNNREDLSVRGNVVCVDGHGEYMTRKETYQQIHTGNPYPDPQALAN